MFKRQPHLLVHISWLLATGAAAQLTESFDGWTDGSYDGTATYNHAGVGIWVSENAVTRTEESRSGNAVRFDDDNLPPPWLEFRGLDGNGIDGGVGTVSFYYRHWDGLGGDVAFQFQYRVNGGNWVDAGAEVAVPNDTVYRLFAHTLDRTDDNITLRILSTANGERLLIDDFEIGGVGAEPVISFLATTRTVSESDGTLQASVGITPGASATVEVSRVSGEATPGSDLSWSPTTLVFSAGAPIQNLSIVVEDDGVVEGAETAVWELVSATGATLSPSADRFTLTILDNDAPVNTNQMVFTVMAANTTSGNFQEYEGPGTRIFEALQPDIVAIQEFNVTHVGGLRGFVDEVFGTNYTYMIEGGGESIPNGVISRWPITASGEWADAQVGDRDFAWATVDIPGDIDLHVISVHLHNSGGVSSRQIEAQTLISQVQGSFPPGDYMVIAGDFNTGSRTEACVQTLKAVFSDAHVPVDQIGDDNTNAGRSSPYDWVMPNTVLDARHEPLTVGGLTFADGVVFDTRLWASPPSPALTGDSGVSGMQHMAVMKAFSIPGAPPGQVSLTVTSPQGSPVPATGVSSHAYGSVISPVVPDPVITVGATQYTVVGWTGTGSIPTGGSGASLPAVTLISNSALAWQWRTNYWLETTGATPTSQWAAAGSTAVVEPAASNYYSFAGWTGDVPPAQVLQNPLLLVMDQPRTVGATLTPDLAARGTPHAWLAGFGWTHDFDTAELADTDGDGMAAWEEYVAGTLPNAQLSRFVVNGVVGGGPVMVALATQPGRTYTIEWADELGMDAWRPFANPAQGVYHESGASAGTHAFVDDFGPDTTGSPPAAGGRAYRVRVAFAP